VAGKRLIGLPIPDIQHENPRGVGKSRLLTPSRRTPVTAIGRSNNANHHFGGPALVNSPSTSGGTQVPLMMDCWSVVLRTAAALPATPMPGAAKRLAGIAATGRKARGMRTDERSISVSRKSFPSPSQRARRALIHDCLARGALRGDGLCRYRESNAPAQCGGLVREHKPLKDVVARAQ
jgi:hypothetical protein